MNRSDFIALSPFIIVALSAIALMLVMAFYRRHWLTALLALAGLAASLAVIPAITPAAPRRITDLLIIDNYALFYMWLIFAASFIIAALSYGYMEKHRSDADEFYILLLLASLGSAVLAASSHFVSFFLGLEILSVSLYVMIAYVRTSAQGNEAGIKYLVLASVSAAFLLFGMGLIYAQLGTMEFSRIAEMFASSEKQTPLLFAGTVMVIIGVGFKLAVVPFHMWTPDVYEGAPAPVTAFIASISKGSVFALLLRYFNHVNIQDYRHLFLIFALTAVASMFTGNLLALFQKNVKRILAYSSISHLGYLLVAFLSSGHASVTSAAYYLVAYFVTTIGAFGVIIVLSEPDRDSDPLDNYRGLARQRPWLAGVFTAMLLSLAGIPLTAGFIGKFYIITAGVGSALWLLLIMLVINSGIGLYYYLRIVAVLFDRNMAEAKARLHSPKIPAASGVVLAVLTLLLLYLGIYPSPLIDIIKMTILQ